MAALLRWVPGAHRVYRSLFFWRSEAVMLPALRRGRVAGLLRTMARRRLGSQVADPGPRAKLTPDFAGPAPGGRQERPGPPRDLARRSTRAHLVRADAEGDRLTGSELGQGTPRPGGAAWTRAVAPGVRGPRRRSPAGRGTARVPAAHDPARAGTDVGRLFRRPLTAGAAGHRSRPSLGRPAPERVPARNHAADLGTPLGAITRAGVRAAPRHPPKDRPRGRWPADPPACGSRDTR